MKRLAHIKLNGSVERLGIGCRCCAFIFLQEFLFVTTLASRHASGFRSCGEGEEETHGGKVPLARSVVLKVLEIQILRFHPGPKFAGGAHNLYFSKSFRGFCCILKFAALAYIVQKNMK